VIELVSFIEATFHIKIPDNDLVPENLDSFEGIERYLSTKCLSAA
jgi:acyl carrier protein